MAQLPTLVSKDNVSDFLNSFDFFLTDCDGVIWRSENVVNNANKVINKLQDMGKKVFLLTNNSIKSRDDYVEKCKKLGFNVEKDSIVSSGFAAAAHLQQQGYKKKAYIIGSAGLREELKQVGIESFGDGPDPMTGGPWDLVDSVKLDPDVEAVIVGFDSHFSLPKLLKAASYINTVPNCKFIATNTDENFPVSSTTLLYPGTGCFVRAVETAVGRKAQVMGKPEPGMFEVVQKQHNIEPARAIMVGDRCNTDILLGKNCGLSTLMVLTGVHSLDDVKSWVESNDSELQRQVPQYYLPSLGDLLPLIE